MRPRTTSSRRRTIATLAAIGLFVAACGAEGEDTLVDADDAETADEAEPDEMDDADEGVEPDETDDAAEAEADVTLAVADSPLGDHLVDGDGNTLYLFTEDTEGASNCTDDCLEAWPAVTADGDPTWDDDVDGSLVDTFEREDDGSAQVTYDGMPLYTFASDEAPGDVNGQGSGDVWYVVAPDGTAITDEVEEDSSAGY